MSSSEAPKYWYSSCRPPRANRWSRVSWVSAPGVPIDTAVAEVRGVDRPRRGNDQRRRRTAAGVAVFGHEPLRLPLGIGKIAARAGCSRLVPCAGRQPRGPALRPPRATRLRRTRRRCHPALRTQPGRGCVGQGVVRLAVSVPLANSTSCRGGFLAGRRSVDKALAAVFQSRPHRVDVRPPRGRGRSALHQLHHGAGDAQIVQVGAWLACRQRR